MIESIPSLLRIRRLLRSQKFDTKENFESIMEHVYNTLMRSSYSRKQHSGPVALQDLNLKSLINNQPKLNFSNEWDIVSGML